MGVKLGQLVKGETLEISQLKGKKIAVDAFLWIHQFLSTIRQADGTPLMNSRGQVTSHLSGIFYRSAKLIEAGIKPIWVFDGKKPEFKYVTSERRARRETANVAWKEALEEGDIEGARKHAQATSSVNSDIIEQSKQLIIAMGMPVVEAPSEGEAQCAHMCKIGAVYAAASQDMDALMFGSPRLVRNLSITGKRKLPGKNVFIDINPEIFELNSVLKNLEIDREKLILMGMLIGTDFNPGIVGIGPKKALIAIKKESKKEIFDKIGPDAEKIFEFFMNPPSKDVKPEFPSLDANKIRKMMVDEFEFSNERISKVIDNLSKSGHGQKGLGSWVK